MSACIVGIGTDIVDVERIRRAMRSPRFIKRILRPEELPQCPTPEWVAGRWAAKEAVAKALGVHLKWHDVAILPDADGRPTVALRDGSLERAVRVHLSISHERTVAVAVVVAEALASRSDTISSG